jgi:hypothetical protein
MDSNAPPTATVVEASSKRHSLRWIVLTVLLAAALGIYAVLRSYFGPTVYEKPGFRFTAQRCERSVETPTISGPGGVQIPGVPAEGIQSRTWRADGSLVLEAVLIENCGTPPEQGDFATSGNTISLTYRLAPPPVFDVEGKAVPMLAACNCPYRLTYEIAGLARADYRIDFPVSGKGVP